MARTYVAASLFALVACPASAGVPPPPPPIEAFRADQVLAPARFLVGTWRGELLAMLQDGRIVFRQPFLRTISDNGGYMVIVDQVGSEVVAGPLTRFRYMSLLVFDDEAGLAIASPGIFSMNSTALKGLSVATFRLVGDRRFEWQTEHAGTTSRFRLSVVDRRMVQERTDTGPDGSIRPVQRIELTRE